ncbi:PKD domain-containing protein [Aquimarina hainanensis]|uniref:PKD domain-containing protein n=1 Tax=Aquimarina hainanensis TaxID=1578017 RepID=A0ABW5NG40_9FLAO
MNHTNLTPFILLNLLFITFISFGQVPADYLISSDINNFIQEIESTKSKNLDITIEKGISMSFAIKNKITSGHTSSYLGNIVNEPNSSFVFLVHENVVEGHVLLKDKESAYKIFANTDGKIYSKKVDIHSILCVNYEKLKKPEKSTGKNNQVIPELESLPGAAGVVYLDFDGEIVENTWWLNGARIDAQPTNFSTRQIEEIWHIMAVDFRPFNINVTTRRAVFDAAPRTQRMKCIFTPTTDAEPDSGGVAYLNSFSEGQTDNPCWVFNIGNARVAGETGSHEVGHALGLSHDGQQNPNQEKTEYYSGHGNWGPIMGWSASNSIGQWSRGEYTNATQREDDIAIIANNRNNVGHRDDDHADTSEQATPILVSDQGVVSADNNKGIITTRADKDVFSFVTETGDVSLSIETEATHANLDIQVRLLNGIGEEITLSNPEGQHAAINQTLEKGQYFLEIDGVGDGTPSNGYTDYSSLGNYYISGTYTPGDNNLPPLANFSVQVSCDEVQFTDETFNQATEYLWDFGDGTTATEQNPTHTYTANGNYTITLTSTNPYGKNVNIKKDIVSINLPDSPTVSDQNICTGETVMLSISGNSNYSWFEASTGGEAIATGNEFTTPQLSETKTYYIEGALNNCISKTRTPVQVVVNDTPEKPIIQITDTKTLSLSTSHTNYKWYINDVLIEEATSPTLLPEKEGSYTVEVFNELGCSSFTDPFFVSLTQVNISQSTEVLKYYIDPITKELIVEGLTQKDRSLTIVDLKGIIVQEMDPVREINIDVLSSGLYILLINNKAKGKFAKL